MDDVGEAPLAAGTVFAGDYRVVRPLAAGGMGAVYVVSQLSTGKDRALKTMRPELASSAAQRERFELEARVGARIESAHVVEVQSAGVDAATGIPYLVMELLDGEDLATRVEKRGPLPVEDIREIFEQLCHAVAAAHRAGVVHRDLKPENVFLGRSRRASGGRYDVKVLDFGIAKLVAERALHSKTAGIVGTPMWMAPEQTERGPVTAAADVWALALLVYFAVTGRSYWRTASDPDATLAQLLREVVLGELPPLSIRAKEQGLAAGLLAPLDAVAERALVRDPSRRLADAAAFWDALSHALGGLSSSARGGASGRAVDPFSTTTPAPRDRTGLSQAEIAAVGSGRSETRPRGTTSSTKIVVPSAPVTKALLDAPLASRRVAAYGGVGAFLLLVASVVGVYFAGRDPSRRGERGRPTASVLPPAVPPGAAKATGGCRLCIARVTASGALSEVEVQRSIERHLSSFDVQCLARSRARPRAGTTAISFIVADGRATNRTVTETTSADGVDQCLARGLADVEFPPRKDDASATLTLSYDPALDAR
ncbi:MAG: serine/threonine protein kinase [Deltaproteobacteria bacterium]|nr:serine/threonine protein kinase [Deltaproteobacteria bacterium]